MTNPFRTDLIAIFIRRGHKGQEIVEEVREIEALLDGQRCEWTHEKEWYAGLYYTSCGRSIDRVWYGSRRGRSGHGVVLYPCCL